MNGVSTKVMMAGGAEKSLPARKGSSKVGGKHRKAVSKQLLSEGVDLDRLLKVAAQLKELGVEPNALLDQALEDMASNDAPAQGGLTRAELGELAAGGAKERASVVDILRARSDTASEYKKLYGESLTTKEAGDRLGVSPSRIRQLVLTGKLYAIGTQQDRRLPLFQFDSNGPLPNLPMLLEIVRDWHPLAVHRFFTSASEELIGPDGQPYTPAQWLVSGGDPKMVIELAEV
ncbi:hypothetical protein [Microbulbifer epialgicus]|uniref:DNA binding domain-containing protein, excisionase family n=1 Tax=Microbulbifer epialgicus TaxID=393907 RepID=A0ABV4NTC6_9GAMM